MSDKYLIFGATGSIGSSLAQQLKDSNQEAHLISRNEDELKTLSEKLGFSFTVADVLQDGFIDQVKSSIPISITDPEMTRFMMTLNDAVDLVLYAFENGKSGDIFVQKAPAATIKTLADAVAQLMKKPDHEINIIGTRHGEKLYEALLSREEMVAADDLGDYFRVPPDLRDLNYGKFVEKGEVRISEATDYNSHNTARLDIQGMKDLLIKLPDIQNII